MKDIAIYCTADDAYIIPSIIALQSIKRFHPESSYFVIANRNRIGKENIDLLSSFDIELIHFGEDHLFPNVKPWTMEAFWKYKGPEIFLERGFTHSICVDGDILCVEPLDLANLLPEIDGYASIETLGSRKENFKDPDWVQRKYELSKEDLNGHSASTGVIFWNDKNVVELRLFERLVKCFQECTSENARMFRAVDQSLFALVSILDPALPWLILPRGYNYRVHNVKDQKLGIREEDIRIYHFTGLKPWESVPLKERLLNPSLLLHRDKYFAFLAEQRVFNRDLTIKNRGIVERISTSVRYSLDDSNYKKYGRIPRPSGRGTSLPRLKYIFIKRDDLFAITISYYFAIKTGKWALKAEDRQQYLDTIVKFNDEELLTLFKRVKYYVHENNWNGYLAESDHLYIDFRDLVNES